METWFVTTCNQPRLRDPTAVQKILDSYYFDWDVAVAVKDDRLIIQGEGWPGAWLVPADFSPDHYEPDFATDGIEEFEALLSEIAPHLAEPLIVQAIGGNQFPLYGCEWQAHLDWQTIAKLEFCSPPAAAQHDTVSLCRQAA